MRDDFDRHRGFYLIGAIALVVFVAFLLGAFDDFKSKGSAGDAATKAAPSSAPSQPADSATGKNASEKKPGGGPLDNFSVKPKDNTDGKPLAPRPPATGDGNPPPTTVPATPTPIPAITTVPTTTPKTTNDCPDIDKHMDPKLNELYVTHYGCASKGDVRVNGIRLYDDVGNTGLIIVCMDPTCTLADPDGNGANVAPRAVFADPPDGLLFEMLKKEGCQRVCARVRVCVIKGGVLAADKWYDSVPSASDLAGIK